MAVQEIYFAKDYDSLMALSSSRLVIIDFFTDWCGPCKVIAPTYIELSKQYPNIHFCKVNGESDAMEPFYSHVKAYPTFLFIKDGKVIDKVVGGNPDTLKKKVAELATNFQ